MQAFKVRCFNAGIWDGHEPRDVEANNALEAAERICGAPLIEAGKIGSFRAEVYVASAPNVKKQFFDPPSTTLK